MMTEQSVFTGTAGLTLGLKMTRKQFGEKLQESQSQPSTDLQDKSVEQSSEKKRQSDGVVKKPKLLCFVCNIVKNTDSKPYNEGGLGRCSEKGSKQKLIEVCVLSQETVLISFSRTKFV